MLFSLYFKWKVGDMSRRVFRDIETLYFMSYWPFCEQSNVTDFFFLFPCQNTYPFWQFHRVRPGRTLDMTVLHNRVVVYCRLLFMF